MSKAKDLHAEEKSEQPAEPVSLTNQDAAVLSQSHVAIAEQFALVASIYHRLAGSAAHGELPANISAAASNATEALEVIRAAANTSSKKRKRDRDPNAPKRPGSSFLMFAGDRREQLKKAHPELSNSEIMRELGNQWRDASKSVREPYERKYTTEIEAFKRESEAYSAKTDSSAQPAKVAKSSKGTKKSTPLSTKATNKSAATEPDSEESDDSGAAQSAKASKSSGTKKSTKAAKPTKSKDTKKSASTSAADKKAQNAKKSSAGKKADAKASATSKKTKKGKTTRA